MQYRRKPTNVRAVQFVINEVLEPNFFKAFNIVFPVLKQWKGIPYIIVPTKHGAIRCNHGDWLVLENDILAVIKDTYFHEIFEKV
jgi:hypothetical protein